MPETMTGSQPTHPQSNHQDVSHEDDDWVSSLYAQDDIEFREETNGSDDLRLPDRTIFLQQNRSVPNLHNQRPIQSDPLVDPVPPPPPYDATAALNSFSALHIGDPVTRGGSAMAFRPPPQDPIPRAGTSMSARSVQPAQRLTPYNGYPGQGTMGVPQGRYPDPSRSADAASVRSGRSGSSLYYSSTGDGGESLAYNDSEGDRRSAYSFHEEPGTYPPYNPADAAPDTRHIPPHQGYAPSHPGPQGYMAPPPPPQGGYNFLYAAASDVLGMGPPPGSVAPVPPPVRYASPAPSTMRQSPYSPTGQAPLQPGPYPGPNAYPPPGAPMGYPGGPSLTRGSSVSSTSTRSSGPPPSASMPPSIPEESEFEPRPSLQRSGTTASVNPRTEKTKAIDLSAPPFTKKYIDGYRQRIKDDPDPEAHFKYAKYLIEAARKVGGDAKDQRSVKKYRDSLIIESLKVMRRLATQGQTYDEAQFFLANCHGTGMLGLQVDHERAYHLYLDAAKQNHAAACYRVAVCNEIGVGTKKEPRRASAFYRKSASLGDTAAMYKLGVILLRGMLGEQPNPREAVGWLKRAAEQADEENPHALHELALLYENPQPQVVPYDPLYAKELYTRAAQLGYTHSQFKLGQCYEYGALTCPVDPKRSIAWYTRAAEKGHSESELALSGWYLTGSEGVLKQSDSEAYLWARRAANKGLNKAEYAVGYYAEVGIGVKQDIEFSKRWYMRAAAQGNKRAMNRLTEMKRTGNKRPNITRPTRQDANNEECVIA